MSSASQVPLPGPGAELKRDVSGDARLEWLIAAARVVLLLPGLAVVHRNDGSTALQRMIVEKPAAAAGAPQHAPTATKPAGMARPAQGPPPAPSKAAVRSARVLKRHERNASRLRIFQEETPQARQERRQRRQSRQQQQDHGVGDGMGEQIELDLTAAAAAADAVACRAAAAAVIASAYHQWSAVRRKRARDDASSVMEAAPTAPERLAAPPTPTASVPPGLGLDSTLVPPPASPLRAASPTPAEPPGDGRPSGYGARRSNLFRTPPSSPRRDRSPVASPPSELPPASLPPLPPPSLPAPPPAQHGTPTRPSPARSTWGDADSDDDGPSPPSPTYVPPHLRGRARPPGSRVHLTLGLVMALCTPSAATLSAAPTPTTTTPPTALAALATAAHITDVLATPFHSFPFSTHTDPRAVVTSPPIDRASHSSGYSGLVATTPDELSLGCDRALTDSLGGTCQPTLEVTVVSEPPVPLVPPPSPSLPLPPALVAPPLTSRGAASGELTASLATLTASALALTGTALAWTRRSAADSDDLDDYSFEGG